MMPIAAIGADSALCQQYTVCSIMYVSCTIMWYMSSPGRFVAVAVYDCMLREIEWCSYVLLEGALCMLCRIPAPGGCGCQ